MPEQTRRFIFVSEAIVFTSGKGGVGKTTVISNIGVELSQLDKKVIMLDTDMGTSQSGPGNGNRGQGQLSISSTS